MTDWISQGRSGPLQGVRILDFSRILSGPYAAMVLADMGADVIKVEPIGSGDETRNFPPFKGEQSHYFIGLNRNKQSIALDLKSDRGAAIARDLAARADVVLENFRPGVMERLGLGYDTLKAQNDRLVYCSITGFGAGSPLSDTPAFDIVAQALSGVMSINREPGGTPNKLGLPLGDMGGSIFAVFGILAALFERGQTGKGRRVDIAMLDSLLGMLGYLSQIYFVTGDSPKPAGTKHPSIVPYGSFPTSDGHVIVACLTEGFWHNFARCLDRPELITDPRFAAYQARLENRDALEQIIEARMAQDSTAFWLDRLTEYDVPNAPILSIAQALEQPHAQARNLVETLHHPRVGDMRAVRNPILFDGQGPDASTPPPLLGEQSGEILKSVLGLTDAQIADLTRDGVLGQRLPESQSA